MSYPSLLSGLPNSNLSGCTEKPILQTLPSWKQKKKKEEMAQVKMCIKIWIYSINRLCPHHCLMNYKTTNKLLSRRHSHLTCASMCYIHDQDSSKNKVKYPNLTEFRVSKWLDIRNFSILLLTSFKL